MTQTKYEPQDLHYLKQTQNWLINSNFDFAQRIGATTQTLTSSKTYGLDRFYAYASAGSPTIQRSSAQAPSNGYSLYSALLTGATSTTLVGVGQKIESVNARMLSGKTLTFSCWVYNATAAAFIPVLNCGLASAIDNFTTVNPISGMPTLQSCPQGVWTQVYGSFSLNGYSNVGYGMQVELQIPSGVLVASQLVYLSQMMLTETSMSAPNALPLFNMFAKTYTHEYSACLRYYEKSYELDTIPGTASAPGAFWLPSGGSYNASQPLSIYFTVPKRIIITGSQVSIWSTDGTLGYVATNHGNVTIGTIGSAGEANSKYIKVNYNGTGESYIVWQWAVNAEL
jgi:hypothetical protein